MSFGFVPLFVVALLQDTASSQRQAPAPVAQQEQKLGIGARQPAFARDGRLAVSVRGDIWTLSATGQWTQVTSGGASDREPSWSFDGSYIVFSSDRSGKLDIWRVTIGASGILGNPEQLTHGSRPDAQPVVAPDGQLIFTRGRGAAAELWTRSVSGTEARLTTGRGAARSAALSPDGRRVAYVSLDDTGRHLRIRNLTSGADDSIITDPRLDHLMWAGDSNHVAFTLSGRAGGVKIADLMAKTITPFTDRRVEVAWTIDGTRAAVTEVIPEDALAYNGDPDRLGDRTLVNMFAPGGALWVADAGSILNTSSPDLRLPPAPRETRNGDAFDQSVMRTIQLYYSQPDAGDRRAKWEKLGAKYRPRAIGARDDDELRTVLHQMFSEHPPYRQAATGRAAVSTANPIATDAGLTILRAGGNVVDAAIAVSFALGVVEPDASGPGGYGQMLIYKSGMDRPQLIEFMSRVPEDAGIGNANAVTGRGAEGAAVANVPGTVAAMYLAWQRHGSHKISWADLLAPAIRAARNGYPVSEGLATTLTVERDGFMQSEGSRALYFKDGRAPSAGDTLRNPDLAWTLDQIAAGGADAFYKGEIAKKMVADLRSHGNAMKLSDMWRYFAADRDPVSTTYRNFTIYSSAPPVDGGATLAARLNLFEHFKNPRLYTEDAATMHAMIAAWQLVPSTRNRIADPSLWPVNTDPFTNKDTARIRWTCFDPARALNMQAIRVDSTGCAKTTPGSGLALAQTSALPACEPHGYGALESIPCRAAGTTAFVVGDADGNVVAVTQTLGTWGGGFYVTPGLGFLYNDKLNSYSTDTTVSGFGVRLPFARHGSTLAPTIVFEGNGSRRRPVMAVGAAGNSWITSAVYQTLVGMMDAKLDPQAALEQPRFQLGGGRGRGGPIDAGVALQVEDGFSPAVVKQLESMGYRFQFVSLMGELREGYGAALKIDGDKVTAGADPRRAGAAGAIPAKK